MAFLLKNIPTSILDALRERGHSDAAIEQMLPKTMFREYCEWHGLIRWGNNLWELAESLKFMEKKGKTT